jgi:hypothetical protein
VSLIQVVSTALSNSLRPTLAWLAADAQLRREGTPLYARPFRSWGTSPPALYILCDPASRYRVLDVSQNTWRSTVCLVC